MIKTFSLLFTKKFGKNNKQITHVFLQAGAVKEHEKGSLNFSTKTSTQQTNQRGKSKKTHKTAIKISAKKLPKIIIFSATDLYIFVGK
jgi:hypothetical protein